MTDTLLPHGAASGGLSNPDLNDPDTSEFWAACAEHRLIVQRCDQCGRHRFPPQPICFNCQSLEFIWHEVSGRGRIYSWALVTHAVHPALADRIPYVILVVELPDADDERLVGNFLGDPADVAIGADVHVAWEDVEPGLTLPQWRLA